MQALLQNSADVSNVTLPVGDDGPELEVAGAVGPRGVGPPKTGPAYGAANCRANVPARLVSTVR